MAEKSDIASMTLNELKKKETDLRKEHFNLSIQHATGQLEATSGLKRVKRNIARVMTFKTQKMRTGEVTK